MYRFYGTQWFSTVFTTACHLFVSQDRWIQSTSCHPISLRFILVLSSNLCLAPKSLSFRFHPTNPVCIPLLRMYHTPLPSYSPDLITQKILSDEYKSCSSSSCSFLCPATSSFSDPNINLPQHRVLKDLQPAFFLLCTTGIFILRITALSLFTSWWHREEQISVVLPVLPLYRGYWRDAWSAVQQTLFCVACH